MSSNTLSFQISYSFHFDNFVNILFKLLKVLIAQFANRATEMFANKPSKMTVKSAPHRDRLSPNNPSRTKRILNLLL